MNQFYTAESVTEGHPDKLCDLIADSVLDECLSHDALSRVACEVLATRGQIIVAGEITSLFEPRIPAIARSVLQKAGYDPARYAIQCLVHKQSPDITAGVDCSLERRRNPSENRHSLQLGAGDQGVMVGYACSETPQRMPLPVVLAHRLTSALAAARKTGMIRACARTEKHRSLWNTARMEPPFGWTLSSFRPSTARISPRTNSAGNSPTRCWPRRCRLCRRTRIRKSF